MVDPIKEAFQKVKEDIFNLQSQLGVLIREINQLKRTLDAKNTLDKQTDIPTDRQTNTSNISTNSIIQTDRQTVPQEIRGLIYPNFDSSTGNNGVQTDRQTDQQTDQQTPNLDTESILTQNAVPSNEKFALSNETKYSKDNDSMPQNFNYPLKHETRPLRSINPYNNISKVSQVLNSLDSLKQDLHAQFKRLTPQEMLVFSTIYQLTDQNISPDYSLLAIKTSLSESSIRDYVQKLIKKGIPVEKTKENNKRVSLNISSEFKRMASLQTLYELRNI